MKDDTLLGTLWAIVWANPLVVLMPLAWLTAAYIVATESELTGFWSIWVPLLCAYQSFGSFLDETLRGIKKLRAAEGL